MQMPIDSLLDRQSEVLEGILVLFEHEREDARIQIELARNAIRELELKIQEYENRIKRSEDYSNIIRIHMDTRTEGLMRRLHAKHESEALQAGAGNAGKD